MQHQAHADLPAEVDYATDVSPGGLFIKTSKPAAANSTIHVQFHPAKDGRVVEAFCKVTRVTDEGMGAAFLQLDPSATRLLTEMCA